MKKRIILAALLIIVMSLTACNVKRVQEQTETKSSTENYDEEYAGVVEDVPEGTAGQIAGGEPTIADNTAVTTVVTTQTRPTTTTTTTRPTTTTTERPTTTTTARPTTTTQSSQNATLDDMLLLVNYIQTANISNLDAFDNTYAYIASSDINYRREASDDLLNAYEYLNQAYNMSVKYDNLNVLSGDLKSARDAIGDAMSWDCEPSEVIDKISECREHLEVVADKCMDILDNW